MLRTISRRAAIAAAAFSVSSLLIQTTFATDFGYTAATGDWTTGANWIDPGAGTGVSPGAADNAYIGASYPGGAISTAAVSLTSVESVNYLILGQSLTDAGTLDLQAGSSLTIGSYLQIGGTSTVLRNGGSLTLPSLTIYAANTLDIVSGDTVNAGGSFQLYSASTLNYDNSSAGPIYQTNVYDGSTLNLQGGTFHTSYLYMGSTTGGIVTRSGGLLDVQNTAYLYAASTLNLQAGDQIGQTLYFVSGGSVASLVQNANDITGLTLNGGSAGNLIFTDPNDVLSLTFDGNVINGLDWVFRWANPGIGFDHVGDINGWITSGNIVVLGNPQPYSVFDNGDGFTYIGYIGETGIPEPTSLAAIALSACMFMRRRRGA